MRVTLRLTPEQANAIVTAWSKWEQYDDPQIHHSRRPPEGKSDWTHGNAGFMSRPDGYRWLTDDLDLSEVLKQEDGTWIFRYSGQRNSAASFFAEGIDWKTLPVLEYQTTHREWPWWHKTDEEERAKWLAFTKTELKAPREIRKSDEVVHLGNGLQVAIRESEPYYFMTYVLDDTLVASQLVTNYEREIKDIQVNLDSFIETLKAYQSSRP